MKRTLFLAMSALILTASLLAQDYPAVMTLRQQSEVYNRNLEWKIDNVLPGIMEREGLVSRRDPHLITGWRGGFLRLRTRPVPNEPFVFRTGRNCGGRTGQD